MGILDFLFGKKAAPAPVAAAAAPRPAAPVAAAPVPVPVPVPVPAPPAAPRITEMRVGESLVGEGNEVAHIDLLIGPAGSAAEKAFSNCLTNNKDGFTALLSVVAPNLMVKPNTVMFNKVTIKGAKQAVQMFGPAQRGVAMAVADCLAEGTIHADQANSLYLCVGVFIHWLAEDDRKIQDYNYRATKEALERAVRGQPSAREVLAQRSSAAHPFAAH